MGEVGLGGMGTSSYSGGAGRFLDPGRVFEE